MSNRKDLAIQRLSSETEHGPPPSSSSLPTKHPPAQLPNPTTSMEMSNSTDDLAAGEQRKTISEKNAEIQRLRTELQMSMGKIKGYQTLGHLFQESKQECSRYKQKNDLLALQLGNLMKRFSLDDNQCPPVSLHDDFLILPLATVERHAVKQGSEISGSVSIKHAVEQGNETLGSVSILDAGELSLTYKGGGSTGQEKEDEENDQWKTVIMENEKILLQTEPIGIVESEGNKRPDFSKLELNFRAGDDQENDTLKESEGGGAGKLVEPITEARSELMSLDEDLEAASRRSPVQQAKDKEGDQSSESSPSFVQISGSDHSDFENDVTSAGAMGRQNLLKGSFMTNAADTLGAEIRQLCEHLDDPAYTQESKAVAADLIRMGVQAMKVAKEGRVKQVLMEQMYEDINKFKMQNDAMRHTINQLQIEREALVKRVRDMEADKIPTRQNDSSESGGAPNSELRSLEWVELVQQGGSRAQHGEGTSGGAEMLVTTEPAQERNYRLQIDILGGKLRELLIVEKQWQDKYMTMEEEMRLRLSALDTDNRRIQYQRDELVSRVRDDASRLLSEIEKIKNELEVEREQRSRAEEKCQTLTEQKGQLEHDLEAAHQLEPAYFLRSSDQQTSTTSPSEAELKNQLLFLTQQVTVFKEDFDQERRDREKAKAETEDHKKNVYQLTKQLQATQQQLHNAELEIANVNSENTYLKIRFQKAIVDVENMQQQVRPPAQQQQLLQHHHQQQPAIHQAILQQLPAKQPSTMHQQSVTQTPAVMAQKQPAYPQLQYLFPHQSPPMQLNPTPLDPFYYQSPLSKYSHGVAPLPPPPPQATAVNHPPIIQVLPQSEYLRGAQMLGNEGKGWSCATCTYVNADVRPSCEICLNPRRDLFTSSVNDIRVYSTGRNVSGTPNYQNDAFGLHNGSGGSTYGVAGRMMPSSWNDVEVDRGSKN